MGLSPVAVGSSSVGQSGKKPRSAASQGRRALSQNSGALENRAGDPSGDLPYGYMEDISLPDIDQGSPNGGNGHGQGSGGDLTASRMSISEYNPALGGSGGKGGKAKGSLYGVMGSPSRVGEKHLPMSPPGSKELRGQSKETATMGGVGGGESPAWVMLPERQVLLAGSSGRPKQQSIRVSRNSPKSPSPARLKPALPGLPP